MMEWLVGPMCIMRTYLFIPPNRVDFLGLLDVGV